MGGIALLGLAMCAVCIGRQLFKKPTGARAEGLRVGGVLVAANRAHNPDDEYAKEEDELAEQLRLQQLQIQQLQVQLDQQQQINDLQAELQRREDAHALLEFPESRESTRHAQARETQAANAGAVQLGSLELHLHHPRNHQGQL